MPATLLALLVAAAAPAAFEIRMGSGEQDLAQYKEYGYNVAVIGSFTQLATYAGIAPEALPAGSPLRATVEDHRRRMRETLRQAAALGLKACLSTDEILLPTAVLQHFGSRIARDDDPERVDLAKEQFWEVYRAKYREVLREFPEIAYVMVRTGENYAFQLNGYTGQLIAERTSATTRTEEYFRNMRRLIEETRRVVVDEFGRTLIWRTWDLGNYGFHASTPVYDRIIGSLPNRKGMIFSIKFTQTDYWRYNDFNPQIGRGGVDQIVEFQCAREYEGKGAFPVYAGEEHAAAMRRARQLRVKGVWIWNFGGGWGGPHLKSDRWVRLNIEATARLARNPDLEPRKLAEEWAAREFGKRAARRVAGMLMLSDDCVLKFRYIAPFARRNKGWLPSRNIMRDDIIRGEKALGNEGGLKILYEGSKHALEEAFAEKREAVTLAARMRKLFEGARGAITDERRYEEARNSLLYMESLATVMSHYIQGMFRYYRWKETGQAETGRTALEHLRRWRQAWSRYQSEIGQLAGVATLYRSQNSQRDTDTAGAMADTCETALKELSAAYTRSGTTNGAR
ncbi:MAG: hypothetical protein AAB225_05805 [Acidobacteriota bacterium]